MHAVDADLVALVDPGGAPVLDARLRGPHGGEGRVGLQEQVIADADLLEREGHGERALGGAPEGRRVGHPTGNARFEGGAVVRPVSGEATVPLGDAEAARDDVAREGLQAGRVLFAGLGARVERPGGGARRRQAE